MKQRMIWVAMLGLALASTSAAQTKISGTMSCASAKADPAYSIDVGDSARHTLGLLKEACTWTNPMQIEGAATKDSYNVVTIDVHGTRDHANGYGVGNMADGEKTFVRFSGTDTLTKDGKPNTSVGTWSFTGGTGKYKGIAGKGTYEAKADASGNMVSEIKGEYTLPAKK
ncbi:MAG TPA: hypothetical protein VMT20_05140 [Terriglobia bacterium]|nr:hypothetical protein [Terriglobia bacterium]